MEDRRFDDEATIAFLPPFGIAAVADTLTVLAQKGCDDTGKNNDEKK